MKMHVAHESNLSSLVHKPFIIGFKEKALLQNIKQEMLLAIIMVVAREMYQCSRNNIVIFVQSMETSLNSSWAFISPWNNDHALQVYCIIPC